jgi:cysteine synthase A
LGGIPAMVGTPGGMVVVVVGATVVEASVVAAAVVVPSDVVVASLDDVVSPVALVDDDPASPVPLPHAAATTDRPRSSPRTRRGRAEVGRTAEEHRQNASADDGSVLYEKYIWAVTATTSPFALDDDALRGQLGLAGEVVDPETLERSVRRFRERGIVLPRFSQLADPSTIPADRIAGLGSLDRDAADPMNLWRVHWHNRWDRDDPSFTDVPEHIVLPSSLTGVESPIIVVFGDRFPMITAHKVMAAYACLAPRVITGQFDPTRHRAIWPSTGNYARGGIAISRLMDCRGVAILPAGMSKERFDWLDRWCTNPVEDVIRTPGSESNVKEIYDACNALAREPENFVLNQFCEFGNHLGHYEVTGRALGRAFDHVAAGRPGLRLAAFTSATGSAGTIAAGDRLKEVYGTRIVAVEALECPTMLENGFGEHNIQGIGDKHIPLIHNVMNTDVVCAVSDRATDHLDVLFNTPAGRAYLVDRVGVPAEVVATLEHFGFSAICNVLAAIKTARLLGLGADDAVVTVATDGAALYPSERAKTLVRHYPDGFDAASAAAVFGEHLASVPTDSMIDCTTQDRNRIFNLGYYTWVEQQGTPFAVFEARRSQSFWQSLRPFVARWDTLIDDFNARTGLGAA